MANSDVIVRIKADAKNYDANLAKATRTLDKFKSDNLSMGGILSQSTTALTGMAASMLSVTAAVGAALKVAGDAFKQNEELMDDWQRNLQAAQAVYDGFLNALNTGNFSGYFANLKAIRQAAREAYDAMDELGTFNAFNQFNLERAKTNFTESLTKFRGGSGSKEDVQAAADALKNELQKRQEDEYKVYETAIKSWAENNSVNSDMFKKILEGSYEDFQKAKLPQMPTKSVYNSSTRSFNEMIDWDNATEEQKLAEALRRLTDDELKSLQSLAATAQATKTEIENIDKQVVKVMNSKTQSTKVADAVLPEGSAAELRKRLSDLNKEWEMATTDESRAELKRQIDEVSAALDKMTGKAVQAKQALMVEGPSGYSEQGIAALRKQMQDSMSGMQVGSGEYIVQAQNLVDLNTFENLLKTAVQNGIELDPAMLESFFAAIDNGAFELTPAVSDEAWATLVDTINEQLKALNLDPIELDVKTGNVTDAPVKAAKATEAGWKAAASAIGEVGGALQQIEDPTAKVAGIIAQAVANIALSFAEAAASPAVTGTGWGWLGFAAAGIATMISTIASIKSVTGGFAQGGIVPGSSYSGDNLTANVNSGELILNRAQQDSLAGQLQNNPMNDLNLSMEVEGTKMLVLLNNTNRSLGGGRDFYTKRH